MPPWYHNAPAAEADAGGEQEPEHEHKDADAMGKGGERSGVEVEGSGEGEWSEPYLKKAVCLRLANSTEATVCSLGSLLTLRP